MRKRKPNSVARKEVSLSYQGSRINARLIKVTPDRERRKYYKGRGGTDLPNAPKNLLELEERYHLLWQYLNIHDVALDDRFYRPASYLPVPSKKQVLYVYVIDNPKAISQFALQCRRRYGLHAYQEQRGAEPPIAVPDGVAS